jgi:hypothetical protein
MTRTEDNGEIALMTQPPQMEASNALRLGLLQQAECQSTRQIDREREARAGTVQMSGDICIWRRAGLRRDYAHRMDMSMRRPMPPTNTLRSITRAYGSHYDFALFPG